MHYRRLSLVVVLVLSLAFSWAALAQNKPIVLKMGLIAPTDHPVAKASEYMAELVQERTGGAIEIQVFPGGVLGGEIELQAAVRSGAVHMASVGDGILASYSKPWHILVMYYLWPDVETMHRIQAGPAFEPLHQRVRGKCRHHRPGRELGAGSPSSPLQETRPHARGPEGRQDPHWSITSPR